jgi:hypothetical protein
MVCGGAIIMKILTKIKYLSLFCVATLVVTIVNVPLLRPAESTQPTELKMETTVVSFTENQTGDKLYALGQNGDIHFINTKNEKLEIEKVISTGLEDIVAISSQSFDDPENIFPTSTEPLKTAESEHVFLLSKSGTVYNFQPEQPQIKKEYEFKNFSEAEKDLTFLGMDTENGKDFFVLREDKKIYRFTQEKGFELVISFDAELENEYAHPITLHIMNEKIFIGTHGGEILIYSENDDEKFEKTGEILVEKKQMIFSIADDSENLIVSTSSGSTYTITEVSEIKNGSFDPLETKITRSRYLSFSTFQKSDYSNNGKHLNFLTNQSSFWRVPWPTESSSPEEEEVTENEVIENIVEGTDQTDEETWISPRPNIFPGPPPESDPLQEYSPDGIFALIDENGMVTQVVGGGSTHWLEKTFGGTWIETWEEKEGHNRANIGMIWDGENFMYLDSETE